jgi:RNA polymerase sigma-70 factor, ECF subfamily
MTASSLRAANHDPFVAQTERFRGELLAHCYRMVGSPQDAQDLVQETYLRAWRSYFAFEGRASVRSWLYQIATNVCLTALESRRQRVLPSALTEPSDAPTRPPTCFASDEVCWLGPLPDAWVAPATDDPAAVIALRESLRLALIASMQCLPARQRAIFLLRDVLAFSAAETAELIGSTEAAVKSGLQRARAQLDRLQADPERLLEPTDPRARELLDGYIAAFERSDAGLLLDVLRMDATLEATPFREWHAGRLNCIEMLETFVLGAPGDWRLIATAANGQPAAVAYRRDENGVLRARDVVVLAPTATGVLRVIAFHEPALAALFGLPEVLAD